MTITALAALGQEIDHAKTVASGMMSRVVTAIKNASQESGVDFSYLLKKASQESSLKPDATAKTSTATGLYQFTQQTWLRMVHNYGGKHGVGNLAQAIDTKADGTLTVKNPVLRQSILDLRKNPEMAASMAAEFAQENRAFLQNAVGGVINNTDLYMAHFLGANGAAQFLQALKSNPTAKANAILPEAAGANRNVFYDSSGTPRSVAQIYSRFAAKMEGKGVEIPTNLPDAMQPKLFAHINQALGTIADLKTPMEGLNIGHQASPQPAIGTGISANHHYSNLANNISPNALFSVMMLAQLDSLSAFTPQAEAQRQQQERHGATG